jgi:demethylmenaquinone methyltransferase/2-methoxy-6-polyprenyl-1,4-benzoquinol methylase
MNAGATPAGVDPRNDAAVARNIREMFGRIAPRYDLLNRLLSMRVDQYWRRFLVRKVRDYLWQPERKVLDLCCGTGDLLIALEAERHRLTGTRSNVLGSDFCRPMLAAARHKLARRDMVSPLFEADALAVPLQDASVDLITIAWGFRNLASYERGLDEMYRLLRPGGCLAILEFSRPTNRLWGPLFEFYFRRILPALGNTISGSGQAYSYLQESVRNFLTPEELASAARSHGFQRVEYHPLTGGISVLHLAYK